MPETCWRVFKRQAIKLRDWCIWLVDLFEWCTDLQTLNLLSSLSVGLRYFETSVNTSRLEPGLLEVLELCFVGITFWSTLTRRKECGVDMSDWYYGSLKRIQWLWTSLLWPISNFCAWRLSVLYTARLYPTRGCVARHFMLFNSHFLWCNSARQPFKTICHCLEGTCLNLEVFVSLEF